MRKNEEDRGAVLLNCGKAILAGGFIAFAVGVSLLLVAAAGISRGILDSGLHYQIAVISCVLGSLAGGIFAVRRCPGRGVLVGLCVGCVLFLLQLATGLLAYQDPSFASGGVGLLFSALCGGAAAGILSSGSKRPVRTNGKKRRVRR